MRRHVDTRFDRMADDTNRPNRCVASMCRVPIAVMPGVQVGRLLHRHGDDEQRDEQHEKLQSTRPSIDACAFAARQNDAPATRPESSAGRARTETRDQQHQNRHRFADCQGLNARTSTAGTSIEVCHWPRNKRIRIHHRATSPRTAEPTVDEVPANDK